MDQPNKAAPIAHSDAERIVAGARYAAKESRIRRLLDAPEKSASPPLPPQAWWRQGGPSTRCRPGTLADTRSRKRTLSERTIARFTRFMYSKLKSHLGSTATW